MKALTQKFGIFYENIDDDGKVIPENRDFWDFLDSSFPSSSVDLYEAFPELVGMEDQVQQVLSGECEDFRLPGIQRGENYLNLSIFAELHMVVIQDASDEMSRRRTLLQSRNEISILQRNLQEKNLELASANERLDSLMKAVREQNHELDRRVKHQTHDLRNTRFKALTALARIAEFRDSDTGGHIYRIGRISVLIAEKLGFDIHEKETIFYASLLHDVGKVGIPDKVLLKPESLSPAERMLIQQHTRIGAEILGNNSSEIFTVARDVALYHHERWDGKGYPEGLSGRNIPIQARICTVADVFDALLSKRPYKDAWPYEEAVSHIVSFSGECFDPDVVEAFMTQKQEILRLFQQSSEELELLEPEFY